MEYSLSTLNENINLNSLQTSELIDKLNLIGFEIDETFDEILFTNKFLENLRILIKIPANREDLLTERNLLLELSTIFLIELKNLWKKTKGNYSNILAQHYNQYSNYEHFLIKSKSSDILVFEIEVEKNLKFNTPLWVEQKLKNSGLKVEGNFQDLITLTQLEWGQMFNCLNNKENKDEEFYVTQLIEHELFVDENNISYSLKPQTIVIKNKQNQIQSVLGIFNTNMESKNSKENYRIRISSIFYDIHENSKNLNLTQDKFSLRYLRQMSLKNVKYSFQRLLTLLEVTNAGKIFPKVYSTLNLPLKIKTSKILRLNKQFLKQVLNLNKIKHSIFKEAGLKIIGETSNELYFSIGIARHDLSRPIDLVEEYSRFIGYRNFSPIQPKKNKKYFKRKSLNLQIIKQYFLTLGFQEIISNPLQEYNDFDNTSIKISNPLNNEFSILRSSLLPRLINIFENNLRLGNRSTNFFEIGRSFNLNEGQLIEKDKLSGIFQLEKFKKNDQPNIEWVMAKGILENLLLQFGYNNINVDTLELKELCFHPTKVICIKSNDIILGYFGEVNPNIKSLRISKFPIYIFEIELKRLNLERLNSQVPIYKDYSKYPIISKDLSCLIHKNVAFSDLKARILKSCSILKKFEFFDIYFTDNPNEPLKVGIRLNFQSYTQTLVTSEIEYEIQKIKDILIYEFNIQFDKTD